MLPETIPNNHKTNKCESSKETQITFYRTFGIASCNIRDGMAKDEGPKCKDAEFCKLLNLTKDRL